MIAAALTLLLAGYLPGAAAFRLPLCDRAKRERLDAEERAFWAVVISVGWSLSAAFTLAALHRYSLTRLLEVNGLVVFAILAGWRGRLRYQAAARVTPTAAVPLALLALCAVLYPPPAEYILGGKDPGVYINAGIQIAQRGRLVTIDETARGVPADARPLFFPQYPNAPYFSPRFMGFFLLDPDRGTVVDQFPHLYPAGIAIGYGVNGLTGAREVGLLAAALGVVALYFLGTRLAGRTAGTAAAALLAINVLEVWYARYPNSEMMAQALGLAALLATARAHVDDDPFFAPVAGALLGLLPFVRFDAVLLAGLATAGVVLNWIAGGRLRAWFLIPLVAGGGAFAVYLLGWLTPYAALPRIWVGVHRTALVAGALAALVLLAAAARLRRQARIRAVLRIWAPRVLLAVALLLAAYAWFLRQPGGALAAHDAYAFRTFGWYVPPPAIALAALGLALLMVGRFWTDPSFFIAFLGVSFFVFDRLHIVPDHFWAARRFVVLILPGTVLAIAAALAPVAGRLTLRGARVSTIVRHLVRLCLLALVAASFWNATRPILSHVEYAGVIPQVEKLAARFGDNDLLVVESRDASDLHVIALPLAYIYAKNVLVLATPKPDSLRFARFLSWARAKYSGVYFLGGGGTDLLSRQVAVEPVGSERFQVPEYESLRNAYPTHVRRKEFDFGIYRFVDPALHAPALAFDIGAMDDLYVVRFHAKEHDARGTFRWTGAQSYLSLVGIPADARALVIWMENGGRSPKAPPAEVEAFLGDRSLGKFTVGRERGPYVYPIPADLAAGLSRDEDAATVRILSTTWNPRALTGADDDRDLGVMVDRVEVRRAPASP